MKLLEMQRSIHVPWTRNVIDVYVFLFFTKKILLFCADETSTKAGNAPISVGAIVGIVSGGIICTLLLLCVGIVTMLRSLHKMRVEMQT